MKHSVYRHGSRLIVGYELPGTDVVAPVADYPLAARAAAITHASRASVDPNAGPYVPPAEREIRRGFDEPLPWMEGSQVALL